jgi:hypothetical protein
VSLLDREGLGVRDDLSHVLLGRFDEAPEVLRGRHNGGDQHVAGVFDQVGAIGAEVVPLIQ